MTDGAVSGSRWNIRETPVVAVSLALAAFLLLRPYEGIVHDGRLYVGYALAPLDPAGVGQDIMFTLDGQGGKTLYPAMMRWLAMVMGLTPALVVLTYGALLLWFAGAWRLVRVISHKSLNSGGIAAVIVLLGSLHTFYGGASTIRFAEPFAAPRALAEALGMLAIVHALGSQWWRVMVLILLAGIVHPIMTAPVVAVIVMIAAPNDRARGVLLGCGLILGVGMAAVAALVQGDGMLLGRFDAAWLQVLDHYHSLILLRHWSDVDLARVVLQLITLSIARTCVQPGSRRLVDGILLVSVSGLVLSLIGVDVLSHRLIGQAQSWRGLWLAAVASGIGMALMVQSVGAPQKTRDMAVGQERLRRLLAVQLLVGGWMLVMFTPAVVVLAVMAWWLWFGGSTRILSWHIALRFPDIAPWALGVALLIGIAGYGLLQAMITWQVLSSAPAGAIPSGWLIVLRGGVPATLCCFAAIGALAYSRRPGSMAIPLVPALRTSVAMAALVLVALHGGQRTAYARSLEDGLARAFVGDSTRSSEDRGSVAWPGGEMESWALLARPSWGTVNQGVAKVFSRPLALRWGPRFEALLDSSAVGIGGAAQLHRQTRTFDLPHLKRICGMSDAPTAVVVPLPSELRVPGAVIRLQASRVEPPDLPGGTWRTIDSVRLVSCAEDSIRN